MTFEFSHVNCPFHVLTPRYVKEFEKPGSLDFCPSHLEKEVDELNEKLHQNVNIMVYRIAYAPNQAVYDELVTSLFASLDEFDERLGKNRYLFGDQVTECDWRLLASLVRFELVYAVLFKCNQKDLAQYPNLSRFRKELMAWPGIKETFNPKMIKLGYYTSPNFKFLNTTQIIPIGPTNLDFVK